MYWLVLWTVSESISLQLWPDLAFRCSRIRNPLRWETLLLRCLRRAGKSGPDSGHDWLQGPGLCRHTFSISSGGRQQHNVVWMSRSPWANQSKRSDSRHLRDAPPGGLARPGQGLNTDTLWLAWALCPRLGIVSSSIDSLLFIAWVAKEMS